VLNTVFSAVTTVSFYVIRNFVIILDDSDSCVSLRTVTPQHRTRRIVYLDPFKKCTKFQNNFISEVLWRHNNSIRMYVCVQRVTGVKIQNLKLNFFYKGRIDSKTNVWVKLKIQHAK